MRKSCAYPLLILQTTCSTKHYVVYETLTRVEVNYRSEPGGESLRRCPPLEIWRATNWWAGRHDRGRGRGRLVHPQHRDHRGPQRTPAAQPVTLRVALQMVLLVAMARARVPRG